MGAVEEIVEWSETRLTPWRQDALRRLAASSSLTTNDYDELLSIIKEAVGFALPIPAPTPVPLARTHLSTPTGGAPIKIKAIRDVKNVNRLVPAAALQFAPNGLTIVYGLNGSGKSGFVRILRTACRTRCDNPATLKVLANVYGSGEGPQEAKIVVGVQQDETVVPWSPECVASDQLQQAAVFDSSAAQLYVDGGNEIKFLPFGLGLPHQLNELCLTLKSRLEAERQPVLEQLSVAAATFEAPRGTSAQIFYSGLSRDTTDDEITEAANFTEENRIRLEDIKTILTTAAAKIADLRALATVARNVAADCNKLAAALTDEALADYRNFKLRAVEARAAAGLDAATLFSNEPLPGVGTETWRLLWLAARNYSTVEAYPGSEFPVVSSSERTEHCVLCQQVLTVEASGRMTRFRAYVEGQLMSEAERADAQVDWAIANLPHLHLFETTDWSVGVEQIGKRKAELAEAVYSFKAAAEMRLGAAISFLQAADTGGASSPLPRLVSPQHGLEELATSLLAEAERLSQSQEMVHRAKLVAEQAELEDRKILSAARDSIVRRRNLLKQQALYDVALTQVATTGITKRANELVDTHLTQLVVERYEEERKALDITHLQINLARKSDQTRAAFQTTTGTALTRLSSDILSEGEQRALALAAFLTEVGLTNGSGPIVVDDPVSSLDRERGARVAARLITEAKTRQVIVFTHDLIFFNDLCREADELGVPVETVALFSDATHAGRIDPAGVGWKGLNVNKRLGRIRDDFAQRVKKLHATSPSEYEIAIKGLYGRLREAYERLVEEHIFCDVVRRGVDRIETQRLRLVHLPDSLAIRFHNGMTKANTHSHDNPEAATVLVPHPAEFENDLVFIGSLITDLQTEASATEERRPSMKLKKV